MLQAKVFCYRKALCCTLRGCKWEGPIRNSPNNAWNRSPAAHPHTRRTFARLTVDKSTSWCSRKIKLFEKLQVWISLLYICIDMMLSRIFVVLKFIASLSKHSWDFISDNLKQHNINSFYRVWRYGEKTWL